MRSSLRMQRLPFVEDARAAIIGVVALIMSATTIDKESTWLEGVLLVAIYVMLGLAFFLIEPVG